MYKWDHCERLRIEQEREREHLDYRSAVKVLWRRMLFVARSARFICSHTSVFREGSEGGEGGRGGVRMYTDCLLAKQLLLLLEGSDLL